MTNLEQEVREFLANTPRMNPESGVAFAERLQKFADHIHAATVEECIGVLDALVKEVVHEDDSSRECERESSVEQAISRLQALLT